MPIAMTDLEMSKGKFGLTIDIIGRQPLTLIVEAGEVLNALKVVEQVLGLSCRDRTSIEKHVEVRGLARAALLSGELDEDATQSVGLTLLWCAMNHPSDSDALRGAVSRDLRQNGKAHLTVSCNEHQTWGFALAAKAVGLDSLFKTMGEMPPGVVVGMMRKAVDERLH